MTLQNRPYDPKRQIKEDEEKTARDAVRGLIITLIMIGSAGAGAFFALYAEESYRAAHPPEILNKKTWGSSPDHVFTNPVLFVDGDKDDYPEFRSLDNELNGYIAETEKRGLAESVSVYFRDLNSGHWTGINEDEEYRMSDDIVRMTLMLAYMKNADRDRAILSQELYSEATDHRAAGYYSADDLINDMVRYADNSAQKVLAIAHPDYGTVEYGNFHYTSQEISARHLASIFHALYDGTYFSVDLSEQALHMLALTRENEGIVAGLRSGMADASSTTSTAHEYGEYTGISVSGAVISRELHDCGIVYFPTKPYLLCVMTKGGAMHTFSMLAGVISTISSLTYNYVDER